MDHHPHHLKSKGALLIQMTVFIGVALTFIVGFTTWSITSVKTARLTYARDVALQVAEAGVDYYRWHMAHAPTDYFDGTGTSSPTGYKHDYFDKSGNKIGEFTLQITPPSTGSTIVTITSTGTAMSAPNVARVIQTRIAIPSFAQFAWVLNDDVTFGTTAEVFGPIHSNDGIEFNGIAHNSVTSALTFYNDGSHGAANSWAVHTHNAPADANYPTPMVSKPTIFEAGRQVGVPAVDFAGITTDLAAMKASAQASGRYLAPSGAQGYRILLKTDDTFDVYRVNTLVAAPGGCTNPGQTGWGTWSVNTQTLLANYPIPANGIVFVEDHVWVEGQINSARITIGAAVFPDAAATRPSIIVNNDLRYTNYDGQDVIGLIAANNVNIGLRSEDDLRIDAALIAQNGRVGRYSYSAAACGVERSRNLLTTYGMLGSNVRSGVAYSATNGYQNRVYNYDSYLLYAPPPSFPLTASSYVTISWEEK
jgi:hypothetical protein